MEMGTTKRYEAQLEQDDDGRWSAWIECLPGCAAWGYSQDEALSALRDAAQAYIRGYGRNLYPLVEEDYVVCEGFGVVFGAG